MTKQSNLNLYETPMHPYKGWEVYQLVNPWLKLFITPELGGRIIQTELDGYGFFFVNPALEGHLPEVDRLGPAGTWMNYGGEKIWPAPQGWESPDLWPGPPDPVLDSGAYTVNHQECTDNQISLTSLPDEHTGLQIDKRITLSAHRSEVTIQATFTNLSDREREWSVWPVLQLNTAGAYKGGRYSITCPVNPASSFDDGYKVMHGLINNPQYHTSEDGNLRVDYQYLVGKVGLDSDANWVAYCDQKTGKVLVTTFQHQKHAPYPEGTSVQIWTQGRGMIYSRNKVMAYADDPVQNPPYLEIELLSPLHRMQPGESADFEYKLLMCTLPGMQQVQSVNKNGVIAKPLKAYLSKEGTLIISGGFGVFINGKTRLVFRGLNNAIIEMKAPMKDWKVSPIIGLQIHEEIVDFVADQDVQIALELYDERGEYVGVLNKTKLCKN